MKNYYIELAHHSLRFFLMIRGESQEDVENYAKENITDFDALKISNAPITIVPHSEGWKPTEEQTALKTKERNNAK